MIEEMTKMLGLMSTKHLADEAILDSRRRDFQNVRQGC